MENSKTYIFILPTGRFVKAYARSVYEAREKVYVKYNHIESNRNNYKQVKKGISYGK